MTLELIAAEIVDAIDSNPDCKLNKAEGVANLLKERLNQIDKWRPVADRLAVALRGTTQRHRIALAHALNDDEPVFDPPAPSIAENLRNVSDAMRAYETLK